MAAIVVARVHRSGQRNDATHKQSRGRSSEKVADTNGLHEPRQRLSVEVFGADVGAVVARADLVDLNRLVLDLLLDPEVAGRQVANFADAFANTDRSSCARVRQDLQSRGEADVLEDLLDVQSLAGRRRDAVESRRC